MIKQLEQVTSHHYLSLKRCPSDTIVSHGKMQESKTNSLLPARKKAKNERGGIASFFTKKKTDAKPTKRNKIEEEEEEEVVIPPDAHQGSSVQVEKTSLILFDEV